MMPRKGVLGSPSGRSFKKLPTRVSSSHKDSSAQHILQVCAFLQAGYRGTLSVVPENKRFARLFSERPALFGKRRVKPPYEPRCYPVGRRVSFQHSPQRNWPSLDLYEGHSARDFGFSEILGSGISGMRREAHSHPGNHASALVRQREPSQLRLREYIYFH